MKMTKIESARIIVEQKGNCVKPIRIDCNKCFKTEKCDGCTCDELYNQNVKDAAAYIKRHESKTKKVKVETDVRDVENVVKDQTVKESLKVDPTPLDIAKMIRDNNYKCDWNLNLDSYKCEKCPINVESIGGCGSGEDDAPEEAYKLRKTLIDSYIAEHEKVEPVGNTDKPVIEPLKFDDPVPEYCYEITDSISRVHISRFILQRTKNSPDGFFKIVDTNGAEHLASRCYTYKDMIKMVESKWGVK